MPSSLNRLVVATVLSGLLASACFFASALPVTHTSLPYRVAVLLLVLPFLLGMYWSANKLRAGVRTERWTEGTLAPLRRITGHFLWKWTIGLLLGMMLVALIFLVKDWHHTGYFWGLYCLSQTTGQLGNVLSRPRESNRSGPSLDWSKVPPLRSEHWGER